MDTCYSYAIGDVVKPKTTIWVNPVDCMYIITDTSFIDKDAIEYGINGCAWVPGDDLLLVSRATPDTIRKGFLMCDHEDDYVE